MAQPADTSMKPSLDEKLSLLFMVTPLAMQSLYYVIVIKQHFIILCIIALCHAAVNTFSTCFPEFGPLFDIFIMYMRIKCAASKSGRAYKLRCDDHFPIISSIRSASVSGFTLSLASIITPFSSIR